MKTKHLYALLIPVLCLAQMGQQGCEPDPAPTCDNMLLEIDVAGELPIVSVTNLNAGDAKYQMYVEGNHCSTSDCPIGISYNDVGIAAGTTQSWIIEPGNTCAEIICCESGWVGDVSAELLLFGEGCTISARASRESCQPE